ncbi:flagellar biosynthetic protein FliQ [Thermacetogenium phaeum DSM 12270]|jgi:flagellar biosynthetic protein FliQ|uniref:Flagellar biosynthetic protein FliQ n=1 Tax=Thermacetogenium phaeum (strain ATCC BAA-254 / DSM 26808 / PB) TaxID=1089553 RepID=K4LE71_THEPS|nr:flagellar biosynthesis protein FliQ [Thermacetogenium phaeum]AFV11321.1 flagellar biosynthetic protein FliQ [Thermacetogenium phaeum DSM 12270]MDN5365297.1 flagellar biosynthesis protein FliQ [Thermacetogenium sp.]MDN5375182.1 flagellar biosynthesis protein FliQ [Thermacetogenium sp.]
MTENAIITLGREALYAVLLVSAPLLGVSLLVGLVISIFQATTQIQEQTLSFVPKIIAVLITAVAFAPWMLKILVSFTQDILLSIYTMGVR